MGDWKTMGDPNKRHCEKHNLVWHVGLGLDCPDCEAERGKANEQERARQHLLGSPFRDFRFKPGDIVRHRATDPKVSDPVRYMVFDREISEGFNGRVLCGYNVRKIECDGSVGDGRAWWNEAEAQLCSA